MKSKVFLVSITKPAASLMMNTGNLYTSERLLAYKARVSSPDQDKVEFAKLLKYLAKHKHWSPFEMIHLTVEITTSLAISAQILRHKSFSFQQFSRRYSSENLDFMEIQPRRQDTKNRQNSFDDLDPEARDAFLDNLLLLESLANSMYNESIAAGVAKESARFLLPQSTATKMYMCGSLRSYIHYLQVRLDPSTQLEHREVAEQIRDIVMAEFPSLAFLFEDTNG